MGNLNPLKRMTHWRPIIAWIAAILAFAAASALPVEARGRHGHHRHALHHYSAQNRVAHHQGRRQTHAAYYRRHHLSSASASSEAGDGAYLRGGHAGFSAIVVDANSGKTLFGRGEHELRHPASVTKVMTLYLLFEQLEKGRVRLDTPLMISSHAAAQAPSKLGLAPGETIDVENAIKAVVTKSANDIACAIAENIGGDEETFARMMTQKAHALGMSRTHYANASGLPDPEQITTAYDLAVLGRAIQDRFPRYYRYFSTHSFAYRGAQHRNHNHLLGRVEGVDGIKTGYTRASGFNLLTSVRRGNRHIVAVVMGGRTGGTRDRIMAGLIEESIGGGANMRTARAITEEESVEVAPEPRAVAAERTVEPQRVAYAETEAEFESPVVEEVDAEPAPAVRAPAPRAARAAAPAPVALLTPPAPIPTRETAQKARPAFVPGLQKRAEEPDSRKTRGAKKTEETRVAVDGSTSRAAAPKNDKVRAAAAATTPSAIVNRTQIAKADTARPPKPGWMIQIGATGDADEANALLSRARVQLQGVNAKGFTEKVQKGKETLYRARFAGLEAQSADAACKSLKRSGFSCFTTKN